MRYFELLNEYKDLLHADVQLRTQLQAIPKGYVTTKKIAGKDYCYLQYTVQGKKKSEYLREEDVESVRHAVAQREPLKRQLEELRKDQLRLESAARILDAGLYRTFLFLKQCAEMDALPVVKRQEALLFSDAMTALEGLCAKPETDKSLRLWARGEGSYTDIYMKALVQYRVVEGMQ
jgi:hypothetical protein